MKKKLSSNPKQNKKESRIQGKNTRRVTKFLKGVIYEWEESDWMQPIIVTIKDFFPTPLLE